MTPSDPRQANLVHMVYFTLTDNSPAAIQKLVDSCHKYLSNHEGVIYFAVGTLVNDLTRDVNVTDFDASLHMVFQNRSAHDKYQVHPRHLEFLKENKPSFKKVRVFDSTVSR